MGLFFEKWTVEKLFSTVLISFISSDGTKKGERFPYFISVIKTLERVTKRLRETEGRREVGKEF